MLTRAIRSNSNTPALKRFSITTTGLLHVRMTETLIDGSFYV